MTDAFPRCARCGRLIEVNRELAADRFRGMHWLCFHLESAHPGDPDAPCGDPACHVARLQLYADALRAAGVDPHALVRDAGARRAR